MQWWYRGHFLHIHLLIDELVLIVGRRENGIRLSLHKFLSKRNLAELTGCKNDIKYNIINGGFDLCSHCGTHIILHTTFCTSLSTLRSRPCWHSSLKSIGFNSLRHYFDLPIPHLNTVQLLRGGDWSRLVGVQSTGLWHQRRQVSHSPSRMLISAIFKHSLQEIDTTVTSVNLAWIVTRVGNS